MPSKDGKPAKKRAPRTPKEKAFVKEYIRNGGNGTQAALAVYDVSGSKSPERSASTIAAENLAKLSVREVMEKTNGLRIPDLMAVLAEGMSAEQSYMAGEELVSKKDYSVRHKYLETALKLHKAFGDDDKGTVNNFFQYINEQKNGYGV